MNQKIISAVNPIPAYPGTAPKNTQEYVVFVVDDDRGALYADDFPTARRTSVQVHYYCPRTKNYLSNITLIRKGLVREGFLYPRMHYFFEEDIDKHHLVFETEIEQEVY